MDLRELEEQETGNMSDSRTTGRTARDQKTPEQAEIAKIAKRDQTNAMLRDLYNAPAATKADRERNRSKAATDRKYGEDNRKKNQRFLKKIFTNKTLRKRSALIPLLLALFGGGGFLTIFFSPGLALVHMKEVFTESLNDQLKAVDESSAILIRSKLKDTTSGSCGAIKINCRFSTMTDRQAKKFEAAGIKVERKQSPIFKNRGTITKLTFPSGKEFTKDNVGEMQKHLTNNVQDLAGIRKGFNPLFASLTDKVALSVMRIMKVSKSPVAVGDTDEERKQNVNNSVSGVADIDADRITIKTDDKGNELYFDSEGNELTKEQVDGINEQAERINTSPGTNAVLKAAMKGASITAIADSACTLYNSARFVSALSKVEKQAQASRLSMAMILNPADAVKAGEANEGTSNYVNNNISQRIPPDTQTLDESKLYEPGSASNPASIISPEAGMDGYSAPGFQWAAYGIGPTLTMRSARLMVGGGPTALLDAAIADVARIVNAGDPNPKEVSEKCQYIQNPVVRGIGLGIGIIAAAGSFGLTTVASVAGSIGLAMALPYIEAQAADIIAGNVFKDLSGPDTVDAGYVGAAGLFGAMAMKRGMRPITKEDGVKSLADNRKTYQSYAETESYLARATPFDITNRFSFLGSVAFSLTPSLQRSKTSASAAMMNIASLIPTSFASLTKSAGAMSLDPSYLEQCNDQGYKAIGVAAGPFCEVRYISDIDPDPIAVGVWMAQTGNIDPESETGEAKDNGQDWNYVKYLEQCVNRTVGWGENMEENEGDGRNCLDPAKKELNKKFESYTTYKTTDEALDAEPIATVAPGTSGYRTGQTGIVGADGWALPIPQDFIVSSGYHSESRPDHNGVDLADASGAETNGKPIFAAYKGRVAAAGPAKGFGNWIVIEHEINGKKISTVYGHMYDDGVLVKVNDEVQAGQEIGKVGSNGRSSGPHLHFEVWEGSPLSGGSQIDPTPILDKIRRDEKERSRNV